MLESLRKTGIVLVYRSGTFTRVVPRRISKPRSTHSPPSAPWATRSSVYQRWTPSALGARRESRAAGGPAAIGRETGRSSARPQERSARRQPFATDRLFRDELTGG